MRQVTLGTSGISVFPLIFGTLPLGPLQANLSPQEGGRLIRHALERGVTMLDSAELYGTYPHLRAALEGYTGEVVLTTKTMAADGETARAHVEKALRELGLERIDIVHLHGSRLADPFADRPAVFEELFRMREQGMIGHVGLSAHYVSAVRKAADYPEIEILHPLINRLGLGIIDGTADDMAGAIATCAAAGKGIYAMKALAGGNLISSARESIRYVLGLPGVHAVALGMLSEAEIDANIALFEDDTAEPAAWTGLEAKKRHLVIMERFCKGCGACVAACAQQGLAIVDDKVVLDESACILCGYCAAACPEFIIRVV